MTKYISRTLLAGLLASAVAIHGQTLSFLHELPPPRMDRAVAVAADSSGIYVAAIKVEGASYQDGAVLRKYDSRGNELWSRDIAGIGDVRRVASNSSSVYVLGIGDRSVLRKYSSSGQELWTRELQFSVWAIAADSTGVYVVGRVEPPAATYLRKYDADGVELWSRRWGEPDAIDNPHALVADATGVYVIGIAGRFAPTAIRHFLFGRKFDGNGNELWNREFGGGAFVLAAAVVSGGFYLATTDSNNLTTTDTNWIVCASTTRRVTECGPASFFGCPPLWWVWLRTPQVLTSSAERPSASPLCLGSAGRGREAIRSCAGTMPTATKCGRDSSGPPKPPGHTT